MSEPVRAPRFQLRLSAELQVQGRRVTGTTRNLSMGGVCVEIDRPLAEGAPLELTLFIVEDDVETEGARGLELSGTVRWAAEGERGYAVGVQFNALTPSQSTGLERAIKAVGSD